MTFIAHFFAGLFLGNCIPHLVSGVQGRPFPSPFANPPGRGDSSPLVNVLWGFLNLVLSLVLLVVAPIPIGLDTSLFVFLAGFLAIGTFSALHFGKVMARRRER